MIETLTLKSIISGFRLRWESAPDARKPNNNTRYQMADGILSAFSVFFMQSSSFLAHQRLMQSKKGKNNAVSLFRVERIPSDPQIRNLLDPLSVQYFHADFWGIWDELNAHQQLLKFRSALDGYLVAMDGVTHFSFENISASASGSRMRAGCALPQQLAYLSAYGLHLILKLCSGQTALLYEMPPGKHLMSGVQQRLANLLRISATFYKSLEVSLQV